ncbi:unnamed protein product [Medioppia subpectinata]|uniref:Uncharacterized protein n=1 Tax=Medioppia subpectinata TaxID=1979941 RepID=A0A7R9LFB2_9ACAR|nr:unnamed protein product [Medioppia subpectinata]CAG2118270.1 unnamed protein product [Medioppia subpectinata]
MVSAGRTGQLAV